MELPVTPPTDYFAKIGRDPKIVALLKLPYKDVLNSCKINKAFNNVCVDPYFWKAKLQRDFPNKNIRNLKNNQYRAQYELFLADEYEDKAEKLESVQDRDLPKINAEIKKLVAFLHPEETLSMQFDSMLEYLKDFPEGRELLKKRKTFLDNLKGDEQSYLMKADLLRRRARKIIPLVYSPKYFYIPNEDPDLDSKFEDLTVSVPKHDVGYSLIPEKYLDDLLEPFIHEPVKDGYLLNFHSENPNIHDILVYITKIDNKLYGEITFNYSSNIQNYYHIPYQLRNKFSGDKGMEQFKKLYPNVNISW